jgi:ATP-dependent Clp protease ATP-binding subunit ClpA
MALGIASTAMPFARTPEAQAERWLRVLRLHGDSGAALQALGVSEEPLRPLEEDTGRGGESNGASQPDAVERIADSAAQIAARRGSGGVATSDLLLAVMEVYGDKFDRVLLAHGTDREEVLERLERARGSEPTSAERPDTGASDA